MNTNLQAQDADPELWDVLRANFLMLFGITAVLIDVNVAQSKLVLLVNFNENYSKCLRLLEEVTTAREIYYY
ncbi:hypothetical protein Tco_0303089 [Tanacetum coccineum]